MKAEHDSRNAAFRWPLGACEAGGRVRLSVRVEGAEKASGELRIWQDGAGELRLPLKGETEGESIWLSSSLTLPENGTLLWYRFELLIDGKKIFCGQAADELGGSGAFSEKELPSFQITVYDKGSDTPSWFRKSVMYQVFPDRFFRKDTGALPQKRGAVFHTMWNDTPQYYRDKNGDILAYDFFGGNIAGIREKLEYLKSLGITVLYLNPVFEAQSSHRYDTGDYTKIDPMLGTNEEFSQLCRDAKRAGIRIILDGVFSHTGADSVYFNRYGTYSSTGAFQSRDSRFYDWYDFQEYPKKYTSWWGVEVLPAVKETTPSYMDFIIHSEKSVLHQWLNAGISGWRLDVLDELPEEFSQAFYRELKNTNSESVLIGEVWEDASHKVSYGKLRTYFSGHETDSVMNYPLRDIIISFLMGEKDGGEAARAVASLAENYPKHNFYALMNLLGSHDTPRIISVLGEMPDLQEGTYREQGEYRLPEEKAALGKRRLLLAVLWQMTYPGVPSVYYGDEIGMQGGKDPYNRAPYDWENGDAGIRETVMEGIRLRRGNAALSTGELIQLTADGDVFAFARAVRKGKDVFGEAAENGIFITVLNRSVSGKHEVILDVGDFAACDMSFVPVLSAGKFSEDEIFVVGGKLRVTLEPLGGVVLKSAAADKKRIRQAGVLLHPTSLPSEHGIGDIGKEAFRFVDWLHEAGQSIWQILPTVPAGEGGSPYSSTSALAGNPLLISPEVLFEEGLLTRDELDGDFPVDAPVDFEAAAAHKEILLRKAWSRFRRGISSGYKIFCEREAYWLDDYALFTALQGEQGASWTKWEPALAHREPDALREAAERLSGECEFIRFCQYVFTCQWQRLHTYAKKRGIRIMGDMPLFVAHDSADVWAHQELFALDADGEPLKVAGVPPDYFCEDGQLWGNPQYDWAAMEKDGFSWWSARLSRLAKLTDIIRIDHFRGLAAYWEVDAGAETAKEGRWVSGPGHKFFEAVREALRGAEVVAEDLGVQSPEVENLRRQEGLPGMQVLEFSLIDNGTPRAGAQAEENCVVYTGTHDNNTAAGWFLHDLNEWTRPRVGEYLGISPDDTPDRAAMAMIREAYYSRAGIAIVPVQDILGLGKEARMNIPGEAKGNWRWRMKKGALTGEQAEWLRELAEKTGRRGSCLGR
ncbi:MAG: 4-alpha-glucanotransferase [Schwartzia sp.]|nr:4-alpha-glucanotransferase [Schwartzia sp. (in: firmicutes)]